MTREDIIRMVREACDKDTVDAWHNDFWTITQEEIERFAALVAAAEREEIAAMFDAYPRLVGAYRDGCLICGFNPKLVAGGIRARGEK